MQKFIYLLNSLLLPWIPLLFLYNQNSQHLYFPHILITGLILMIVSGVHFRINQALFKSAGLGFVSSLFLVVLLFAHNNLSGLLSYWRYANLGILMASPILSFIISYGFYKVFKERAFENIQVFVTIFVCVVLGMNLYPLLTGQGAFAEGQGDLKFKTSYVVDDGLPSPNIYWFLVDGMLGFDAMSLYFEDSQALLMAALNDRGFMINKSAMLEVGRSTSIAVPTLFCPDYHDRYLSDVLSNHDSATAFRFGSDSELYSARVNNETMYAFESKGYTTATISIKDKYFLPTTDYYYYIDTYYKAHKDYLTQARLVKKETAHETTFDKERIYAHQLGNVFLDGLPSVIYDRWFSKDQLTERPLTTKYDQTADVLLGSRDARINYALIESLYDVLYSKEIKTPKFVMIHNLMAHWPFHLDDRGQLVERDLIYNVESYPGHHTYATKVLVNMIDMILEEDPEAIIIIQADHGLHLDREDILQAYDDPDAVVDLWNNVFSAVRIPEIKDPDKDYELLKDPRNISRFLINHYVGDNYDYLVE